MVVLHPSRSFSVSRGLVSQERVFLAASSYWYPHFENQLLTFTMKVKVPNGWRAITQGQRLASVAQPPYHQKSWALDKPQLDKPQQVIGIRA